MFARIPVNELVRGANNTQREWKNQHTAWKIVNVLSNISGYSFAYSNK